MPVRPQPRTGQARICDGASGGLRTPGGGFECSRLWVKPGPRSLQR
ncbi:hypothetical protein AZ78_3360 [Lysobacter capsici AZ78]|uniref:Uncharacterized protein n=1 Tax=Lysobacter capsici AZ78 TaxID=1444315 RepID=A0A120AH97_9GAMM|nr:hypothetical protein AZ78_3360 [Lysobacter capsici AZ78]